MKKGCGITLLVFAVLNLIVAFVIAGSGAPANAIGQKFGGAFLLAVIGGTLYYYGTKGKNESTGIPAKVSIPTKGHTHMTPVDSTPRKATSYSAEDNYENLFEELKAKCHPKQFMEPYDHEKVKLANELYARILEAKDDTKRLEELRVEAKEKLAVKFSSKNLYEKLMRVTNPANFMNPYDAEKVAIANDYYQKVQQNASNIVELEAIWKEVKENNVFSPYISNVSLSSETGTNEVLGKAEMYFYYFVFYFIIIVTIGLLVYTIISSMLSL